MRTECLGFSEIMLSKLKICFEHSYLIAKKNEFFENFDRVLAGHNLFLMWDHFWDRAAFFAEIPNFEWELRQMRINTALIRKQPCSFK